MSILISVIIVLQNVAIVGEEGQGDMHHVVILQNQT